MTLVFVITLTATSSFQGPGKIIRMCKRIGMSQQVKSLETHVSFKAKKYLKKILWSSIRIKIDLIWVSINKYSKFQTTQLSKGYLRSSEVASTSNRRQGTLYVKILLRSFRYSLFSQSRWDTDTRRMHLFNRPFCHEPSVIAAPPFDYHQLILLGSSLRFIPASFPYRDRVYLVSSESLT